MTLLYMGEIKAEVMHATIKMGRIFGHLLPFEIFLVIYLFHLNICANKQILAYKVHFGIFFAIFRN